MSHITAISALLLGSAAIAATLLLGNDAKGEEFPSVDQLPAIQELPDPLVMFNGTRITSKEQWLARRKPELKTLFQHYMYGNMPAAPQIKATIERTDDALDGKATMKQVAIAFGPPDCPKIHLLLFVPKSKAGHRESDHDRGAGHAALPTVFLGMNFSGNHAVLADERIAIPTVWVPDGPGVEHHRATAAGRGTAADRWQIEHVVDRGFAVATFYYGDIAPDKPGLDEGVFPFFRPAGQTAAKPTDWASIAAWAWGAQRTVDYLVTDPEIDGRRIVVFGHSRLGKAALLAGAFDDRIAAVIAHQAGCGGSAPSRSHNPKSEPVTKINSAFPHWFDAVFKTFSGREDRLPFDQNCLVSLCAPRPVLFGCGTIDQWADPPGELEVLKAANSVYRLFGLDGIAPDAAAENDKIVGNSLCYFIRESPHTVDKAYWDAFMDFANRALPPGK